MTAPSIALTIAASWWSLDQPPDASSGLYGRAEIMKRRILLIYCVALLWAVLTVALVVGYFRLNRHATTQQVLQIPDANGSMLVSWDAPPFLLTDQNDKKLTDRDLRGHPYVADFIYTQCTSACPIITSKLLLVQKSVTSPAARFVSFSVDPAHDNPATLLAYAQLWHGDPARWELLSTTDDALNKITAGFNVTAEKTADVNNPILHTSLMFLVDADGRVRGLYDSNDETALRKLIADFKTLTGDAPPIAAAGDKGAALFSSMGCLACHSQPRVAPPLASVYNSMVRLDDHRTVWADDAYLHESIVDPNAKVVSGYAKSMPNYRSFLTDAQVMDLVDYIKSLSINAPGGHGFIDLKASTQPVVELLRDPVCKMSVTASPDAPHLTYQGHVLYFCSQNCLERFQKNPNSYPLTAELAR